MYEVAVRLALTKLLSILAYRFGVSRSQLQLKRSSRFQGPPEEWRTENYQPRYVGTFTIVYSTKFPQVRYQTIYGEDGGQRFFPTLLREGNDHVVA